MNAQRPVRSVLITGADGFTGRYMIAEAVRRGYRVHGIVRRQRADGINSEWPAVQVQVHVCDLLDQSSLTTILKHVQPDKVVHLAGVSFVDGADPETIYRTNLLGTRSLLEALTQTATPPSAVLLASSANVYGNATEGVLNEETPPSPANDYAVSKLAMEHLANVYKEQLPWLICRPFNYSGVGQAERFLLPKIVAHARRRAPFIELGNVNVARDFSDVRTVVYAYAALLETADAIGRTFNVCSGKAFTLTEIVQMVEGLTGHSFEIRLNAGLVRKNEVKTLLGSRERLDACIGNVPGCDLRSTLAWMLS